MIGIFVVAVVTALPVMAHAGHLDMEFTAASEGSRITPQVAANHPCDTGNTHPCPAGLASGQIQAAHPCDTGSLHPCPVSGSVRNPETAHPCDEAGVHPCEATLAMGKSGFSSFEVS